MSYISRAIEQTVLSASKSFGAVLLTGPRQVGKTTLLKWLAQNEGAGRAYVSLDDMDERAFAVSDPKAFLEVHPAPLIIDEIQHAPELFSYLKLAIDAEGEHGLFWLTGSQVFDMMHGVRESMAGRMAILTLWPFSQRELHGHCGGAFTLHRESLVEQAGRIGPLPMHEMYERIFRGGMPAIVANSVDRDLFFSQYLSTFLEKDVRQITNIADSLRFLTFLRSVAARAAQQLNYRSLAQDADVDQATVKRWLDVLKALGVVYYIHPYSNNTLKRTIKSPKLYFFDTGVAAYLTQWPDADTLMNGAMAGAILENFVVTEIVKGRRNLGKQPYLYYYRDKSQREIDLVISEDRKLHPIEIKRSKSPSTAVFKNFKVLSNLDAELSTGAIICLADALASTGDGNYIVPAAFV